MCLGSGFSKFTLVSTLLIVCLSLGYANPKTNKGKPSANQQQVTKQAIPATIEGSASPHLIPDYVAYDIFLRSLTREPGAKDSEARRPQIQANKTGVKDDNLNKLLAIAEAYGNRVAALDRRAAAIKDKALPKPKLQDEEQLADLQKEKETLLAEFINSMATQLGVVDADKLRQHIRDQVKRNITTVQIPQRTESHSEHNSDPKKIGMVLPPRGKILGLGHTQSFLPILESLASPKTAQSGMGGTAYIYAESWFDAYNLTVYGRGTITESYNSYGHTFLHTVRIRASNGSLSTSNTLGYYHATMSATAGLPINSLIVNEELIDGLFLLEFETTERCPASYGALFTLPLLTLQEKVAVVSVDSLTATPLTIKPGVGAITLTASLKASGSWNGSISVNVIPYMTSAPALNDAWTPALTSASFTSPGQTTKTFSYTVSSDQPDGTTFPVSGTLKLNLSAATTIVTISEKMVAITVQP
jgi:hypothetical protein